MARTYEELSTKFIGIVRETIQRRTVLGPDDFNKQIDAMLDNLHRHLEVNNSRIDDIKARKDGGGSSGWTSNLKNVQGKYRKLYALHKSIIDEERAIDRIERRASTRALVFRFLTTLGIGFGVMIVYYIAQELGIDMPLIRVPV